MASASKPPRLTPGPKVTAVPRGRKPAAATPARPFQPPQAVQASPSVSRKVEQPQPPPVVEQPQEGQVLDTEAGHFEALPPEAAYLAQEQVRPGIFLLVVTKGVAMIDRESKKGGGGILFGGC